MRSFSEEKKSGNLDLLLTRPLTNLQIVLGKYLASVALIVLTLLPVLTYYISVILLGDTVGNMDHGAFWGSFIGLLLLAASYASIGIFSSALSDNIIVSFLIAVFLSFLVYSGFDYIASLFPFGGMGNFIQNLGIDAHYQSISRGVVDSRDLLYFLSIMTLFILFTKIKLSGQR
jgi:ABC-2 type transport system permease protein